MESEIQSDRDVLAVFGLCDAKCSSPARPATLMLRRASTIVIKQDRPVSFEEGRARTQRSAGYYVWLWYRYRYYYDFRTCTWTSWVRPMDRRRWRGKRGNVGSLSCEGVLNLVGVL